MSATLDEAEVQRRLQDLEGWSLVDGRLHRQFRFDDFNAAFGFMTRLALVAEKLNHHPDWSNSWNTVTLDIASHSAGGITEACVELATAADRLA